MTNLWSQITQEHVSKAVELFDREKPDYRPAQNTFLVINHIEYPAKFIRGMAYKLATGFELTHNDYSGGKETVRFLNKLGFEVKYKNETFHPLSEGVSSKKKVLGKKRVVKHKIARLIVTKKQFDRKGNAIYSELVKLVKEFISDYQDGYHFDFIVTPGGFLRFEFPIELQSGLSVTDLEASVRDLQKAAANGVEQFLSSVGKYSTNKLAEIADFITLGIDGTNPQNFQHVEFVAIYNLKRGKIVGWTGKFYPTENQKRNLVKVSDLNSHFVTLNHQRVAILGCHDLNVFSPRGQAMVTDDSYKGKVSKKFQNLFRKFKPDIILQHPHNTDSPRIWSMAWNKVDKEFPQVAHYASGIKYYNKRGKVRGKLDKVLSKTMKGDVVDFYI
jgi:hypothetical protein